MSVPACKRWVERPLPCKKEASARVNPMYCCFHTQNDANNANPPHKKRYVVSLLGVVIYKVKTIKQYISWYAIIRADANHLPTSMPMSQVSFNTSNVQNPHHIRRVRNMILPHRSNFESLTSIMANAIRRISNVSLYNDIGSPVWGKLFQEIK